MKVEEEVGTATTRRWATEVESRSAAIACALARFGEAALRAGAAHGLSGADLDEVLQDVRIRLWRASAKPAKLETLTAAYIYRAAASAAIDLLRRRRIRREQSLEGELPGEHPAEPAASASADDEVISAEMLEQVEDALQALVPNRRSVVRMHLQGYGREEIAALLRWSEAKTRNLLYRGLDDLRAELRARGIEP